jgi:hypothetical protein
VHFFIFQGASDLKRAGCCIDFAGNAMAPSPCGTNFEWMGRNNVRCPGSKCKAGILVQLAFHNFSFLPKWWKMKSVLTPEELSA